MSGVAVLGVGPRDHVPWLCAGAVLVDDPGIALVATVANDPGALFSRAPGCGLGQGSDSVQLGAEPVGVPRTPPAVSAGKPRLAPLRWGVASARGANSGGAEAVAPAVICAGGPITRVEVPPAALVDAVLAALGV